MNGGGDRAGARYRVGVDVGGTHTDLVLLDAETGELMVEKVASTPANPALGVLDGLARLGVRGFDAAEVEFFSHGTTITTNALLEMGGASVGVLITAGYRAIQEVQNQARDGNPFDYFYDKPPALAPQSLTFEIPGRVDYAGNVLTPLDMVAVRQAAGALKDAGVQSIAVCYLFSFMNPDHEQTTRDIIAEVFPAAHVSLSCEVLPRIREWPRLSTTLLNAYIAPVLVGYIDRLAHGLDDAGFGNQQRFLMQSNGGVMPFQAALGGGNAIHTLFSGPAAGVQGAAHLAADAAGGGLVTLDMGGTSCDIAFIEDAKPLEVTESTIGRRQLGVPALDLATISAGGGSIAWIDGGGFLAVGPKSAGADPGPACYGKGGVEPTVTDADVVCGFLNPDYFLGGAQTLDFDAAEHAINIRIARRLNLAVREAAAGIRRIVDQRMADQVRVVAAKRGVEPRDFTLLPFGGAGAVHAVAVAEELGIGRILVPARPGAFSALGLLCSDVVHDHVRSQLRPLDSLDPGDAEAMFRELEAKAAADLKAEGLDAGAAVTLRELDLRYAGQGYELRVSLDGLGALDGAGLAEARARFDREHARIHGHAAAEKTVEVVSYRLRVRMAVPKYQPSAADTTDAAETAPATIKGRRMVWFDGQSGAEAPVYERDGLGPGATITGPAIVEQFDATTVLPEGWQGRVDAHLNLILERAGDWA
ncbi:MAG: hydantoinase/oxoprolinase family protein [Alphaproteobacteria bacterium]